MTIEENEIFGPKTNPHVLWTYERDEYGNVVCNHDPEMKLHSGECPYCTAIINMPLSEAYWGIRPEDRRRTIAELRKKNKE